MEAVIGDTARLNALPIQGLVSVVGLAYMSAGSFGTIPGFGSTRREAPFSHEDKLCLLLAAATTACLWRRCADAELLRPVGLCFGGFVWVYASGLIPGSAARFECIAVVESLCLGFLLGSATARGSILWPLAVASGAVSAWSTALLALGRNTMVSGTVPRAGGPINDPNELYILLTLGVIASVALLRDGGSRRVHVAIGTALGLSLTALMLTWFRISALAVGAGLWAAVGRWSFRAKLVVLGCTLLFFIATLAVRSAGTKNLDSENRSTVGRELIWRKSIGGILRHPLTGFGPGEAAVERYDPAQRTTLRLPDTKNEFLFLGLEFGLPGLTFAVYFTYSVAKAVCYEAELAPLAGLFVALLVLGLVDTPIGQGQHVSGNLLFGYLIGGLIGSKDHFMPLAC